MMKNHLGKIKLGLIGIIGLLLFVVSGCSNQKEQSTLERVQEQGYITVGFANEQPYAYMNEDLELSGVSVDIARKIMENLGVTEIEGVLTEFASLIPGLQASRFEVVTAGMFLTPERVEAEGVQFANPEFTTGEGLAVQEGNPQNLHSYEDIAENDDILVSVPSGTIEYDYLIGSGVTEERIVTVPDLAASLSAIQADRADAMTATEPALQSTLETAGDESLELVEDFDQPIIEGEKLEDYGGAVFREADQEFIEAWDEELAKLEESGELLEIYEDYGFSEENMPEGTTPEEAVN